MSRLMVSDYRCPLTPVTPEVPQVCCRALGDGAGVAYSRHCIVSVGVVLKKYEEKSHIYGSRP